MYKEKKQKKRVKKKKRCRRKKKRRIYNIKRNMANFANKLQRQYKNNIHARVYKDGKNKRK